MMIYFLRVAMCRAKVYLCLLVHHTHQLSPDFVFYLPTLNYSWERAVPTCMLQPPKKNHT